MTAVSLSSLIIACVFYVSYGLLPQDFLLPRSLPIIEGLLVLTLVGGARFSVRLSKRPLKATFHSGASKVLIVGAGNAGQQIALDLIANSHEGLQPIGFIDDNPELHRLVIAGLPVFGGREKLAQAAESNEVSQVFIAIPSASGKVIREYLELCASANLSAKTIPGMLAILQDKVRVSHLREVEIEDLLRREPIWLNLNAARSLIDGKRVLVTGGGGSIGSEICRQALQCGPRELAVLGHGENSVFETVNSLKMMQQDRDSAPECKGVNIVGLIADVRERARIRAVIDEFRPDIIFHAAAHKHVPLMESNPVEAITNNVFGTMNVLDAAIAGDVPNFVMISTDKAVNPTSVMGASKRVAEMLVLRAAKQTGKRFVAVRFGNVLGSRGSVVPTFKKQLAIGGPLTVSHPEMQRYFMTIPEAVHLVLQAALIGKGGEVFVADMGEPVKIVDLAKDLIELSGLELGRDIDIVFTGIRPGEKLYEELFVQEIGRAHV